MQDSGPEPAGRRWRWWLPWVLGFALLGVLLARIDLGETWQTLRGSDPFPVVLAALLNGPLLLLRILRWRALLASQNIRYPVRDAVLAYLGSIYLGIVTPGRLGELVRALHVARDCGVSSGRAMASVLLDRLFDLYGLLALGLAAVWAIASAASAPVITAAGALVLVVPVWALVNPRAFAAIARVATRLGRAPERLFAPGGWIAELRAGMRDVTPRAVAVAVALTAASYAVFAAQTTLLAAALSLHVGWGTAVGAAALGNLVALLPVSVSGLGTREAGVVAYLGSVGIGPAAALGFSLLMLAIFWIASGITGGLAWLAKPIPLRGRASVGSESKR